MYTLRFLQRRSNVCIRRPSLISNARVSFRSASWNVVSPLSLICALRVFDTVEESILPTDLGPAMGLRLSYEYPKVQYKYDSLLGWMLDRISNIGGGVRSYVQLYVGGQIVITSTNIIRPRTDRPTRPRVHAYAYMY